MQKLMITVLFASSTVAVLGAADCDAAFGAESCTAQPTSNLLQMEKAEAHGAIIASETPAYEMNKTDTKCSQQGGDRLFRVEDLDLDGCYQQCSSTAGCNYFSIALQGQYKGVCMGCKTGITDPHDKFIFYNMGPLVSTTTTSTVSVVTPFTLNATNIKCAYRHADRLFRKTGLDTHGCYIECSNTANCNYFSVALEGPYAGVCMGCVQGVTQPHKSFNFYSMPSDEPLPDAQDQCDEMAYTDRVDCGWWGVTPEACMEKGCCWRVDPVPNPNHIPYCFRRWTALPSCEMAHGQKTDCGYYGITADECESNGCCFRQDPNPNPNNIPYCYHPAE